jgi:hypothetical protein
VVERAAVVSSRLDIPCIVVYLPSGERVLERRWREARTTREDDWALFDKRKTTGVVES